MYVCILRSSLLWTHTLRPYKYINKVTYTLFVHNFCQSHELTISVQNVVHLHARMLSVAPSSR